MSNGDVALALEASKNATREGKQGGGSDVLSQHQRGGARRSTVSSNNNRVSLQDINNVMADTLASLLLPSHLMAPIAPVDSRMGGGGSGASRRYHGGGGADSRSKQQQPSTVDIIRPRFLSDIVELVAADPARKFFESSSYPRALGSLSAHLKNARWPHCVSEALRGTSWGRFAARCPQLINDPSAIPMGMSMPFPTDRYAVVLRGATALPTKASPITQSASSSSQQQTVCGYEELRTAVHSLASSPQFQSVVKTHCPFADVFGDFTSSFTPHGVFAQPTSFHNEAAHVTLFHTSQSVGQRIAFATSKAEKMFNERAFLHHYERYGIEGEDMEGALAACWHVARAYNAPAILEEEYSDDDVDVGDDQQ